MQSMPITTKSCEFESRSVEVYSIQHYVIKFVSDLSVVFIWYSCFLHDITEILLKVALITINQPTNQKADGKCNFRMVTHFKLIPSILSSPVDPDPGHHVASIIHVFLIIRNPNPRWPPSQEIV